MCCYTFKVSSSTIMKYMYSLRLCVFSFISSPFHSNSIKFLQFRTAKPSVKYRHSFPSVVGRVNEICVIFRACVSAIYAWHTYWQPQETCTAGVEGWGLFLFLFLTALFNRWLPSCWCCCFPGASAAWKLLYQVTSSNYFIILYHLSDPCSWKFNNNYWKPNQTNKKNTSPHSFHNSFYYVDF